MIIFVDIINHFIMERLKYIFYMLFMTGGVFKLMSWSWGNEILLLGWLLGLVYFMYKIIKG